MSRLLSHRGRSPLTVAWIGCVAILGAANVAAVSAAGLRPIQLRCEYQSDPMGIDARHPRLSWILDGDGRDRWQTAYRVVVASNPARLRQDHGDLWDSGEVPSGEQNQIAYSGLPLRANQDCFWKIRAWDETGRPGPWSRTARWRMALLEPSDWRAKWIGGPVSRAGLQREAPWLRSPEGDQPSGTQAPGVEPLPLFRKEFTVRQRVTRAVVHVTGLGHYELFLDGGKVGDHFLDPAWTVYEQTVFYDTYDITKRLHLGAHGFGVMLGKGFYNTVGDRRVHGVNAHRPLRLILQAHLTYADGTDELVVTDESWRTRAGPITHSAILAGEDYDARQWTRGWDRAGFDDSGWDAAVLADGPGGVLAASFGPPLTRQRVFPPVRIDEPRPGVFVYDFGQNAAAIPRLRVRGKSGQAIRLTPAEQRHGMTPRRNDGRGLVNPAGVGSPNYFQYTLRGQGLEEWAPQFSYTGFQYLQLEGGVPRGRANPNDLPVVQELASINVRNDAPVVGEFECSNPLFNRIDRAIDWAVRANLSHVLTDCPHREKLGWLEVAYLMGPSIAGRYDIARFYRKIARDCVDSQAPDGLVPTVAPSYPTFSGGFAYTPEWGAAAVVVPWQLYEWYGDRAVLVWSYPTMRGLVDYMERTATDLVPVPGLGDWYDYGHGKAVGPSQFTPPELSAMATFGRCARIVADTAALLGKTEEARRYRALSAAILHAFNARWFDGQAEYKNHGSPQTANSMALVTGMVPPERERAVLDAIVADVRQRGNQQTAGDIGYWYLLQALANRRRSDVIYDLVARTNLGSYGFIVNNGWTSMPEAWDADTGASMNHCMLGHIQDWFLGWVAGVRLDPASPGAARFIISPTPGGDLTWARGRYDSMRGRISSAWQVNAGQFRLKLTVPPNTIATVRLPVAVDAGIRESGQPLDKAAGVRRLGQDGDNCLLEVASGTYAFAGRWRPADRSDR